MKYSSLSIDNPKYNINSVEYEDKVSLRAGIELEYVLPFNNNKWNLTLEPTYQSYKSTIFADLHNSVLVGEVQTTPEYESIEVPVGIRHYFFLNKNSSLFVNVNYKLFEFLLHSNLDSDFINNRLEGIDFSAGTNNIGGGFGFNFKSKYSLEFRYQGKRNILKNYISWNSSYSSFSLILGYNFL